MSDKFPRLTPKKVENVLSKNGFIFISSKGSHFKWRNEETNHQVIVPKHSANKPLPIGTLKAIVEGSGIPVEEWIK